MYRIEIHYQTGDSFNTFDEQESIEYSWNNLDAAKQSLQHIKNHYIFYQGHENIWQKPDFKLPEGVVWDDEYRMILLNLVKDDGKFFYYSSFWTGYFETLHKASIEQMHDSDMVYKP